MLLYLAQAARKRLTRFRPRHFITLTERMAADRVRWTHALGELPPGEGAIVIGAPGSYSMNRELARLRAGGAYVFDALTTAEKDALARGRQALVLDMGWEALYPTVQVVKGVIEGVKDSGLDPARIRLVHCNQAARAVFEARWRELTDLEPCLSLEFPTSFALGVLHQHANRDDGQVRDRIVQARARIERGDKSRRYNCFNGEARPARLHFIAWLHSQGALNDGYVSLLDFAKKRAPRARGAGAPRAAPLQYQRMMGRLPRFSDIYPSVDPVMRMVPIELDLKRGRGKPDLKTFAWSSQDPKYYDDSWFSVVIDTGALDRDMLFITEKAMKPFMNASPMLYLGNAGAWAQLGRYGFEGYGPQIDEAYDASADEIARMGLVMDEFSRLAALSPDDMRELCRQAWPAIEHNYGQFWGDAPQRLRASFHTDVLDRLC